MPPKGKKIGRGGKVELENAAYQPPHSCTYDWPLSYHQFKPREHQAVNTLIQGQIYTLPKFFSSKVCDDLIRWFLTYLDDSSPQLPSPPLTGGKKRGNTEEIKSAGKKNKKSGTPSVEGARTDEQPGGNKKIEFSTTEMPPRKNYAARVNDRAVMVDRVAARLLWASLREALTLQQDSDDTETAEMIKELFDNCIGLNENFRVYRYRPGHYFGQHYDESVFVQVEDCTTNPDKIAVKRGVTRWTLLIYLTGEAEGEVSGGATMFYPEIGVPVGTSKGKSKSKEGGSNNTVNAIEVLLEKGTLLLHKHGQDCLLHEGALVTSGAKWVLRSDMVFPMVT